MDGRCSPRTGYSRPTSTIDQHGDSRQLAVDLASFIAALQRIDPMGGPAAARGEPLAARDEPTRDAIEALRGELDTDAVTAAWEAALQAPPWASRSVWVHADLAPGNVLLVRQRLGAVIDCSLVGRRWSGLYGSLAGRRCGWHGWCGRCGRPLYGGGWRDDRRGARLGHNVDGAMDEGASVVRLKPGAYGTG